MEPDFTKPPTLNTAAPGNSDRASYAPGLNQPQVQPTGTSSQGLVSPGAVQAVTPASPTVSSGAIPQQAAVSAPTAHSADPVGHLTNELQDVEAVHKAKLLIERTKTDPYMQSKEVGKMRIDYLNKRFGKEIKVDKE